MSSLEVFLGSLGSVTSVLEFPSPSPLRLFAGRFCLSCALLAWTRFSNRALNLPFCVTPSFKRTYGGTGISTRCPSPTPFGLSLGPDLPWADEPSPGNLRFSAGRILTCLLAYLCQHSHFSTVHYSLRYSFNQLRTLPYHWEVRYFPIRSFGVRLSPVTFSAQCR